MRDLWKVLGLLGAVVLLPACSGDSFTSSAADAGGTGTAPGCTTDPTLCAVTADSVVAISDKITIKSDGFDEATITATVLDTSRAAVEGAIITFSVTSGKLSTAAGESDENGQVTTKFSATPDNPTNGVTFVTATVAGVGSYAVPITISGTTLAVAPEDGKNTLITSVSSTKTVLVTAANAAGLGVYGASISFALAGDEDGLTAAPTGTTISPNPATTDINGNATVTLTGVTSGTVYVAATGLGTSDQELFLIQDANAFHITAPTPATGSDYVEMIEDAATPTTVTVTYGGAAGTETVWFTTTIGQWTDVTGAADYGKYYSVPISGTTATLYLKSLSADNDHGFATVYAFVEGDTTHSDSIQVAMSPDPSSASTVIVQTDEKTVFPSTATTTNSTKVHVQVRTNLAQGNYPIANVPVSLELQDTTGGGESLAVGLGYTDVYGNFETTFTAGYTPTGQSGVTIVATVAGELLSPPIVFAPAISGSKTVEIGGVPGSVALGTPRVIVQDDDNNSINTYVMSALVADGTGAAVSGAEVTLHFWPTEYYTGVWYKGLDASGGEHWYILQTGSFLNEDINENGILDPGEDVNSNGQLDPQSAYGGASPPTVTTGSNGAAPFNYVYLKDAADWVKVRAQGSTRVFGTESTTATEFVPESLKTEVDAGNVNNSPFRLWLTVDISTASGDAMTPGTLTQWAAPGTTVAADKGSFNASNQYNLPIGSHVAGDTEVVTVTSDSVQFTLYVLFIP